jgi:hypothetical protein
MIVWHACFVRIALALLILVSSVTAERSDNPVSALSGSLPKGWRVVARRIPDNGGQELVIERAQAVRVGGRHLENPHIGNMPAPPSTARGPEITLALRYRMEPRWDAAKLAAARAANARIYNELSRLRAHYRIEDIRTSKGRPLPTGPDEEQRLTAYEADRTRETAKLVRLPYCTLGDVSLFDSPDTYAQLDLIVDPPGAMREAYAIVELVKRRCR